MFKKRILKAVIIIGLIGLGHISGKLILLDLISGRSYPIYARFESVAGLETGYPVKMRGLKIGRVTGLEIDQDNQAALAELIINKDITIYEDAFASIKICDECEDADRKRKGVHDDLMIPTKVNKKAGP